MIEINDASGKQVLKCVIPEGRKDYSMDCSKLSAGIYFVMTETNGVQMVEKVMKR